MQGRKQINCFVIKAALKETINPYSEVNSAINKILIGLSKGCFRVNYFLTLKTTLFDIYFYLVVIVSTRGPLHLESLCQKVSDDYVMLYR